MPATEVSASQRDVVVSMLEALEAKDLDGVEALLADEAVWINVSLPTVRGKERIMRILRGLAGQSRFRVYFHTVADDGEVVLTERTDALGFGRFEQRFWVYGRFEVRDGQITVWRDSFDWGDMIVSLIRALAGVLSPGLNRRWPGD
jgi:limonene-1,2-epoxide hydrolase